MRREAGLLGGFAWADLNPCAASGWRRDAPVGHRGGTARSVRMRLTTLHVNRLITPTSTPISRASHQWKRAASTRPQATPMGVIVRMMGFAIFMTAASSQNVARQVLVLRQ